MQERLCRESISLRTEDQDGQTALRLAVCKDRKLIASILLDKVADTEATKNSGDEALYLAAILDNQHMIKLLADFNANIKALNLATRTTVLHAAVGK
ncbi:hypothetical protein N431DRAFT_437123 [Stipitochalara longipes BDJ]|nr:hypothetical protein N431DRAFT_437123 [Stipitochalara longipes BDJ]